MSIEVVELYSLPCSVDNANDHAADSSKVRKW